MSCCRLLSCLGLLAVLHAHAEFLHVKPGKGAAFVRSKLRNLLTNSNQEKTFRGGETINLADVSRREAQYTYADGDQVTRGHVWLVMQDCSQHAVRGLMSVCVA